MLRLIFDDPISIKEKNLTNKFSQLIVQILEYIDVMLYFVHVELDRKYRENIVVDHNQ